MVHVCFGLYDKTGLYSKYVGTTMLSIFENINSSLRLPSVTVHILHDNTLTPGNRDKFFYLAGQYNQLVKFYNVEELCAEKIETIKKLMPGAVASRTTVGTFYRLFIPQIFSREIEKVIYLDADIIVNLDLNEMWKIELGDKPIAGVPEMDLGATFQRVDFYVYLCRKGFMEHKDYFNAGVLIMNLNVLRAEEKNILSGFDFAREHNQPHFSDQDILNYCFAKRALKLPKIFNSMSAYLRRDGETQAEKRIYHYGGSTLGDGVGLDSNDFLNRLWMKYFIRTPWFNEESIGHLYEEVRRMNIGLKNSMLQISAMMSGKTRAFFTLPPNVEATKKIFSIRDDEEIIWADNPNSLQKLIDAMKLSKGKKVFFILVPGFPFQALIQAGFVFAEDFLNGFDFLSEAHGIKFNSYPLLNAM